MEPIVDRSNYWTPQQTKRIEYLIRRFQKKFPQLRLAFLFSDVPSHSDLSLFAYWYFNVAPFAKDQQTEDRLWSILFAHDTLNDRLAVIPGYSVEPFISDDQWDELLASTSANWEDHSTRGIKHYFSKLHAFFYLAYQRNSRLIKKEQS